MKKSVELTIRASEIRSEINSLEPGDGTLENRRELLGSLNTVEAEWRTAVADEVKTDEAAPDASGLTGEEREFRQLETKGRASAGVPQRHERRSAHRGRKGVARASRP